MAVIPYAKVFIKKNGRDLTDYVQSFYHEAHVKKDNISEIKLCSVKDEFDGDDVDIVVGAILTVTYGFAASIISETIEMRIANIEWDYKQNGQEIIRLLCSDKGNVMKKGGVPRVWKNKKGSEIAQEIADIYELNTEITPTKQVYKSFHQGNISDYGVLHELSRREGAHECFVSLNTLVFRPVDFGKPAKRVFELGVDAILIDVNLKELHQRRGASSHDSSITGIDPRTKNFIRADGSTGKWSYQVRKGANGSSEIDAKVNEGVYYSPLAYETYETIGKSVGGFSYSTKDTKSVALGAQDVSRVSVNGKKIKNDIKRGFTGHGEEGQSITEGYANSDKHVKKKKVLTAVIEVELELGFRVGDIVAIRGIAKRISGNWYVESVRNSITSRGITRLELTRDASVFKVKDHDDPTKENNNKIDQLIENAKTQQIFGQGSEYRGTTSDELRQLFNNVKEKIHL